MNNIIFSFIIILQPSNGKTPLIFFYRFSIFSSSFLIYLIIFSIIKFIHRSFSYKNKTLVHLTPDNHLGLSNTTYLECRQSYGCPTSLSLLKSGTCMNGSQPSSNNIISNLSLLPPTRLAPSITCFPRFFLSPSNLLKTIYQRK